MKKGKVIAILAASFIVGLLGSLFFLSRNGLFLKPKEKLAFDIPEAESLQKTNYNILLLGYGGEGHDGGSLSDVLMLVNFNPEKKKVKVISIPRDLWVDIPVRSDASEKYKINSAFAIGSSDILYPLKEPKYKGEKGAGQLAKDVVSKVVDQPVDYFLAVDFGNFRRIIDLLGGVEVLVPVSFEDRFYPVKGLENETCGFSSEKIAEFHQKYSGFDLEKQFYCRYETLSFDAGKTKMNGEVALKFVRSRHSSTHGGDFARSERQKALLLALSDKLTSWAAIKSAREIFTELSTLVKTDITLETFGGFFLLVGDPRTYEISFVGLSTENVLLDSRSTNGQYILVPKNGENNWKVVWDFVESEIGAN